MRPNANYNEEFAVQMMTRLVHNAHQFPPFVFRRISAALKAPANKNKASRTRVHTHFGEISPIGCEGELFFFIK